jgi:hypothetical protein
MSAPKEFYTPAILVDTKDVLLPGISVRRETEKTVLMNYPNGDKVVNFCSSQYRLIHNSEIFPAIEELLNSRYVVKPKYIIHNDCEFFVNYVIEGKDTIIGKSVFDKSSPIIRVTHSYNSKRKFTLSLGIWRQICSNGMFGFAYDSKINMLHTESLTYTIQNDLLYHIEKALEQVNGLKSRYEVMTDISVQRLALPNVLEQVINEAKLFPKKQLYQVDKRIQEELAMGVELNQFTVYNGFNYVLNHSDSFNSDPETRVNIDQQLAKVLERPILIKN